MTLKDMTLYAMVGRDRRKLTMEWVDRTRQQMEEFNASEEWLKGSPSVGSRQTNFERSGTERGVWEVLLVLMALADDDELAALEATLDEEGRDDALAALVRARQEHVRAQIEFHIEEGC